MGGTATKTLEKIGEYYIVSYLISIAMTSTRNRNMPGDYRLDKKASLSPGEKTLYLHSPYGIAQQTHFPGLGLIGARIPRSELSTNSCDIETQLFGIGSCDLENPRPQITPAIKPLTSLNICDRTPLIMPRPVAVNIQDQKPLWLN